MKKSLPFLIIAVVAVFIYTCSDARSEQKRTGTAVNSLTGMAQARLEVSGLRAVTDPEPVVMQTMVEPVEPEDTTRNDTLSGGVTGLSRADFLQKVWNYESSPKQWQYLGEKPAIIDFYADWCGPCRIASPILDEVSWEFAGQISVYKIDTQKERELAAVFGVRSIPAFLYIPLKGKPAMTSGIKNSKEGTKQMFIDQINSLLLQE